MWNNDFIYYYVQIICVITIVGIFVCFVVDDIELGGEKTICWSGKDDHVNLYEVFHIAFFILVGLVVCGRKERRARATQRSKRIVEECGM